MNLFIIRVIISFFIGGLFVSLQTLIAERVSPKWRGVILALPSTLAIGLFFIGLTKSTSDVSSVAVVSVMAIFSSVYIFTATFAFFSRWGIYIATITAFSFWFLSSILLLLFPPHTFFVAILAGLPVLFLSYYIVNKLPQFSEITPVPLSLKHITIRAIFAGSLIVITIVLAKVFGNVWGGVFSAFPAVFTITFIIYYFVHGKEIIPAVAKSFFFPGSICLVLYSIIASLSFPKFGIWLGTLISYTVVILFIISYQEIKQWINFRKTMKFNIWNDNKIVDVLKDGGIVVMPTDTIYGIVGRADSKDTVESIYKARKRTPSKRCIILIGNIAELEKFSINLSEEEKNKIKELWFSGSKPTSVVLDCPDERFSYLHRGTNTLAFRVPAVPGLQDLLIETGPLIAPSANTEALPPSRNILEAKRYFGDKVYLYVDGGEIEGEASRVVKLDPDGLVTVIRG